MKSNNEIRFKGAIGKDAQVKEIGGNSVAEFSVATDYEMKRKDGTTNTETTWLNIVVWKSPVIRDLSRFKKGEWVSGTGRMRCRKYTDAQGGNKERWEVVVNEIDILVSDSPKVANTTTPNPAPTYTTTRRYEKQTTEEMPF